MGSSRGVNWGNNTQHFWCWSRSVGLILPEKGSSAAFIQHLTLLLHVHVTKTAFQWMIHLRSEEEEDCR